MAVGLQEMHPAMVHFPIALLPLSLGADALGRVTGDYALLEMGRRTMPLAAAGAVTAAVFGLIAQEAVHAEGQAHDLLVTHRTLNAGLVGVTAALAASSPACAIACGPRSSSAACCLSRRPRFSTPISPRSPWSWPCGAPTTPPCPG